MMVGLGFYIDGVHETQYQNPVMNVKLKITRFWNRVYKELLKCFECNYPSYILNVQ